MLDDFAVFNTEKGNANKMLSGWEYAEDHRQYNEVIADNRSAGLSKK